MATKSPSSARPAPGIDDLRTAMVEILAQIQAASVQEVEADVTASDGDLEITSPEAVAILAALERRYGCQLARVEDLEPEQLTSLNNLQDLILRRWPTVSGSAPIGEN